MPGGFWKRALGEACACALPAAPAAAAMLAAAATKSRREAVGSSAAGGDAGVDSGVMVLLLQWCRMRSTIAARVPDAVQRAAVHRRCGTVPDSEFVTVPGLQRTVPLR